MSRAGLVSLALFFATCISLAASAPLPGRLSSLSNRYDDYDANLFTRSLAILDDREFDISDPEYIKREYLSILDDREFDLDDEYTKREYDLSTFDERDFEELEYTKRDDDSDVHMLYRRKSIFTKIRDGFRKFGHAIKSGFQKAGRAIKKGFQKVGKVLKKGFQKVGKFIKTVGAKIVKFGLKVVAAVGSVVAKVVKFIPGVGPAISTAIKAEVIGANAISNKIHVSLGKKLDKASKVMDYIISPVGSVAKTASKGSKVASAVASLLF